MMPVEDKLSPQINNNNKNKMSSDMRSVPDLKKESPFVSDSQHLRKTRDTDKQFTNVR